MAGRQKEKKDEKEQVRCHYPLQGYVPNDKKKPIQPYLLQLPPPSNSVNLGTTHKPLGDISDTNYTTWIVLSSFGSWSLFPQN
jgi:hypothetical protein